MHYSQYLACVTIFGVYLFSCSFKWICAMQVFTIGIITVFSVRYSWHVECVFTMFCMCYSQYLWCIIHNIWMHYSWYLERRVEVNGLPEPAEHNAKHCHHNRLHVRSTAVCVCCGSWSGWLETDCGRLRPVWDLPVSALCPTQLAGNLLQVCVYHSVCVCVCVLSLIHISEPTRLHLISYAVFC